MQKGVLQMACSIPSGHDDATKFTSLEVRPQVALALRRRRRPKRQKKTVLFFLSIAILLSFYLTVGEIEGVCGGQRGDTGGENTCQFDSEGGSDATAERDSVGTSGATTTKIKILDPTHNLPQLLTSPRLNNIQNRIWIVIAYRETCEFSLELLDKLKDHAIPSIEFKNGQLDDISYLQPSEMIFVPMPIDESEVSVHWKAEILKRMGITRLPSLFFLWDDAQELKSTSFLENILDAAEVYRGRSESITDLVNGLHHYLSRLQVRSSSKMKRQEHKQFRSQRSPLAAIRVESLNDLRNIIRNADETSILQNPPLPLGPDLSQADQEWIRYLMDDQAGETRSNSEGIDHHRDEGGTDFEEGSFPQVETSFHDPYHVFIQCRHYRAEKATDESSDGVEGGTNLQAPRSSVGDSVSWLYREYDQIVKVLGPRRDTLFSILEPGIENDNSNELSSFCDSLSDDGLIRVWDFPSNQSLAKIDHDDDHDMGLLHDYFNNTASLVDEVSSWLLPEVLWFDRRMAAPIAFRPSNRRHAILFVDFHDRTSASNTRNAIRLFREECKRLRAEQQFSTRPFVCMVVPSTEIRVLNSFGIDIWSHLDHEANERIKETLCKSRNLEKSDALDDNICDSYDEGHQQAKDFGSNSSEKKPSKFSSVLPTMLITDRQEDGAIHRYYLDPPISSRSISEFFDDFVHGRLEPEIKSGRVNMDSDFTTDGEDNDFPSNKHFVHLLTADSIEDFLRANREKHVLVELYAPTCGHCKRFNTIWNSLGSLIEFLGWSDKLLLARIDVTSNEIIVPGMAATWLPDLFYFGVGVSENPIHYGNTPSADDIELGSINDPLDLLEWWMNEARDVIDEVELLYDLENTIVTFS